jgi:hypothetical protein
MLGEMDEWVALANAVERYRLVAGYANAYETVRGHAARSRRVHLGEVMPASKVGGRWCVRSEDLERGLEAVRRRSAERARMTAEYERRVLHGADGVRVATEWGWYERRGPFHVVHHSAERPWKTNGSWQCTRCWASASLEHKRDKCHRCAAWGDCGQDCTLSAVWCDFCGQRIAM